MVSCIASVAAGQGPDGSFEVSVSVTLPEEISAADGVYVELVSVALLKVPVPEVVHIDEVALPLREPASV